jgi:PAS domain S-box-containing protein
VWVLVVDEDPEVRGVVRRGLEREGCQVVEALNGDAALGLVNELVVDVAVLDRHLPGMSGFDLVPELRRSAPAIHIIMLTGAAEEADRVPGSISGADDYLAKPFSPRELAARVAAARRRRRRVGRSLPGPAREVSAGTPTETTEYDGARAFVVVRDGQIAYASPAAVALLGATSLGPLIGRDVLAFLDQEFLPRARARFDPARPEARSGPEMVMLSRQDGRRVPVLLASAPIAWDGLAAIQVSLWEQSASRPGERPLLGAPTRTEAIVVLDAEGHIESLNPTAEQLYGWSERELQGRRLDETIGSSMTADELDVLRETLDSQGHWRGEVDHRRRDGSTVRVRSSSTVLRHRTGRSTGMVLVNRAVQEAGERAPGQGHVDAELVAEIRRGISQREFVVHYQPVVRLEDGSVVGMEALVRWQHPQRGLLVPAAFLGAAEQSGVIVELGGLVLDDARVQWEVWHEAGHDLSVSVNLSGRQLADPDLPELIAGCPLPAGTLWLEVPESSLVGDPARAGSALAQVSDLGARVAIDGFGTGWASLSSLGELPVHALKIDPSFVRGVGDSPVDTAITAAVLSLGRELGLQVCAEGIETADQHARLRALGCELGQGYLFGPPAPPDRLDLKVVRTAGRATTPGTTPGTPAAATRR